jgi:microcystin-dependent protein
MKANLMANSGGSQPHENMMPYLTINFVISLYGVYPTQ